MEVHGKATMYVSFSKWSYEDKCELISAILEGEGHDFEGEVTLEIEPPEG